MADKKLKAKRCLFLSSKKSTDRSYFFKIFKTKKILLLIATSAALVLGISGSIYNKAAANPQSFTLTWQNANILVGGGSISGTLQAQGQGAYQGSVSGANGCNIFLLSVNSSDTSASMPYSFNGGEVDEGSCDSANLGYSQPINVPISGTPPSGSTIPSPALYWSDDSTDNLITVSGEYFSGALVPANSNSTLYSGSITNTAPGESCNNLQIQVTYNSAKTSAYASLPYVSGGGTSCDGQDLGFTQSGSMQIAINGTIPTQTANANEQTIITLDIASNIAGPSSIIFYFHTGSVNGDVVDTQTSNGGWTADSNGGIEYTSNPVYLKDGQYTVCFSDFTKTCYSFTKTATPFAHTYSGGPVIAVNVQDSYGGDTCSTVMVGPDTVLLEQNGKTIQTIQTSSVTNPPTSTCSTSASSNSTVSLYGYFADVKPGIYQVCPGGAADSALSASACQTVTVSANGSVSPNTVTLQENTTPQASGGSTSGAPSCESSGASLSWIMCPIITGIANAVDGIYSLLIQPLLVTKPVILATSNPLFVAWSEFRVFGNIILVICLMLAIYAEATGGGVLEAYNVKKMLPRIIMAAILINLSIYLVAAAVDVTNVLGNGIAALIEAPFKSAGAYTLTLNGGTSAIGLGGIGLTALVSGAAIWGLAIGVAIGPILQFFLVFILLPALLTFIAILVTVLIRRGLILFLVIVSPVALALHCLPNTDKYARRWWELLFRTLLIYPIIAAIFAISNVLSVTIDKSGQTSGIVAALSGLMAMMALIVPLFLIPFSFRIAGDAIGTLHKSLTDFRSKGMEAIKGNPNDPRSLRNKTKYGMKSQINAGRGRAISALSAGTKIGEGSAEVGRGRRRAYGALAKVLNYGNLEAERAQMNEEQEKFIAGQYSIGGDNSIRALWAKQYTGDDGRPQGNRKIGGWYTYSDADGKYKEWSTVDVNKAKALVGRDPSKFQSYAKYEFGKAADDGQLEQFKSRFLDIADENHWTPTQAGEVWSGVKFAHQNTRREQKHDGIERGDDGKLNFRSRMEGKGYDQFELSRELADSVSKGGFAGFRDSTAVAALEGYNQVAAKAASGETLQGNDLAVYENYKQLAEHLNTSYFTPTAGMSEQQKLAYAAQAAAQGGEEGGETPQFGGYGLGASAKAEVAWRGFVGTVLGSVGGVGSTPTAPPRTPPRPGGGGAPPSHPDSGYAG